MLLFMLIYCEKNTIRSLKNTDEVVQANRTIDVGLNPIQYQVYWYKHMYGLFWMDASARKTVTNDHPNRTGRGIKDVIGSRYSKMVKSMATYQVQTNQPV